MAPWKYLIRFVAAEDGKPYYAVGSEIPQVGAQVTSFASLDALESGSPSFSSTIKKVFLPIPPGQSITSS
jgi:hypothetical protein